MSHQRNRHLSAGTRAKIHETLHEDWERKHAAHEAKKREDRLLLPHHESTETRQKIANTLRADEARKKAKREAERESDREHRRNKH